MEEQKLIKPFSISFGDDTEKKETKKSPVQVIDLSDKNVFQPFTTIDTPKPKLYLILMYSYDTGDSGSTELSRDFEFVRGTTQQVYDHIKELIESYSGADQELDLMKSLIYVDSPNISIGHRCTLYMFMSDTRATGRITDDSDFDIKEWYYLESEEEKTFIDEEMQQNG